MNVMASRDLLEMRADADATSERAPHTDWSTDLGVRWQLVVLIATLAFATAGWLAPLADADLPMHLRVGEWIVAHGAVPFQEPFAWTREGDRYYAYSWLAQVTYYRLLRAFGAPGLHSLQSLIVAGGFLIVVVFGRIAQWRAWPTMLVALLHAGFWASFVLAVRPQAVMALTVPMAWIGAELLARGRIGSGVFVTFAAAFLTANTHLLFPVTLVPVVRLLADESPTWKGVALFVIANAAGWALNPYVLVMPELMRLNLTSNAMSGPFSSVTELEAGWRVVMRNEFTLRCLVLLLVATQFAIPARNITNRERLFYGLAWASGLALFGAAVRALTIWIIVSLPLLARIFALLPAPRALMIRRATTATLIAVSALFVVVRVTNAASEPSATATTATRQLPSAVAVLMEPFASWADCAGQSVARSDARPLRVFTTFNYGSYLLWRVPQWTYSIDSRGIFPDSIAKPEIFQLAGSGPLRLGPWRSADIAIMPLKHAAALALDSSPDWQRVRVSISADTSTAPAALWVKNALLPGSSRSDTLEAPLVIARPTCRNSVALES